MKASEVDSMVRYADAHRGCRDQPTVEQLASDLVRLAESWERLRQIVADSRMLVNAVAINAPYPHLREVAYAAIEQIDAALRDDGAVNPFEAAEFARRTETS